MSEVSKEARLVSIKFKSQLTRENGKEAPKVSKFAIQDSCRQDQRSDWPLMQMSYLVNDWKYWRNLPAKNWFVRKASFARSRVCRRCRRSMLHAAWYPATLYKYYVEGVERNKIIINEYLRLHLRLLFVMSEVSKALYTQMNRMKPQILQWLPHYLIRSRSHCNSNFNSKWVVVRRNNPK